MVQRWRYESLYDHNEQFFFGALTFSQDGHLKGLSSQRGFSANLVISPANHRFFQYETYQPFLHCNVRRKYGSLVKISMIFL
jgi:hypothetical protein